MVEATLLEQVLRLPAEERQELIHELSDSLAIEEPISEEMKALIDERLDDIEANPDAWRPWDEVKRELLAKYRA